MILCCYMCIHLKAFKNIYQNIFQICAKKVKMSICTFSKFCTKSFWACCVKALLAMDPMWYLIIVWMWAEKCPGMMQIEWLFHNSFWSICFIFHSGYFIPSALSSFQSYLIEDKNTGSLGSRKTSNPKPFLFKKPQHTKTSEQSGQTITLCIAASL